MFVIFLTIFSSVKNVKTFLTIFDKSDVFYSNNLIRFHPKIFLKKLKQNFAADGRLLYIKVAKLLNRVEITGFLMRFTNMARVLH